MTPRFTKSFTQQAPLPKAALNAAQLVLDSAGLHRYQPEDDGFGEVARLEEDFAAWQGSDYCLALASGGQAIQLALRASGVKHADLVLTNAFTLAPVPGAISAVGGKPVLVETTQGLTIDLNDLEAKAKRSGAKYLLLSHMRGYLADMDALMELANTLKITVIEDCAHTMGATWNGTKSGNFGAFACFSTQTYKHINSGEGGLLTTNDPDGAARAVIMSGSYMNYARHGAVPSAKYFEQPRYDCPNMSARLDNLRAALLRPQLNELENSVEAWRIRHDTVANALHDLAPFIVCPQIEAGSVRVGSSLQFRTPTLSQNECASLIEHLAAYGVDVKWFGSDEPKGFTSQHSHWRYVERQNMPRTDVILKTLFDMRIPLSFSVEDCTELAKILSEALLAFKAKAESE